MSFEKFINNIENIPNGVEIGENIKESLKKNYIKIENILGNISHAEIMDFILILQNKYYCNNIDIYLEKIKSKGGINVDIDLGNYCNQGCAHCSINGNNKGSKIGIKQIEKYFQNFSTLNNLIKEITFFNSGEFLDRDDFDHIIISFLKKGVNNFKIISRGPLNIKNHKVIKSKFEYIKKNYPNFSIDIGISIDLYSFKNFDGFELFLKHLKSNVNFLYNLNKKYSKLNEVQFHCTYDELIEKQSIDILNIILKELKDINNLKFINNRKIYENINIIELNDNLIFTILLNKLESVGRGKYIVDNIIKREVSNYDYKGNFGCGVFTKPLYISIKNEGKIKTCSSIYLSEKRNYSYGDITKINENEFLDIIISEHVKVYKDITVEQILKLINVKRKGGDVCLNNMLVSSCK